MSNAIVFTRVGCSYASGIKNTLISNNIPYTETVIGRDMMTEDYNSLFPCNLGQSTVTIDGEYVGGLTALKEWVANRPRFLVD